MRGKRLIAAEAPPLAPEKRPNSMLGIVGVHLKILAERGNLATTTTLVNSSKDFCPPLSLLGRVFFFGQDTHV